MAWMLFFLQLFQSLKNLNQRVQLKKRNVDDDYGQKRWRGDAMQGGYRERSEFF